MIEITNSLSRTREKLEPMESGKIRMYVCGPTVYNFIHVGNARPLIFFDVVRRFLAFRGYAVKFVSNYTDVDDKIIDKARAEGVSVDDITRRYIDEYDKDRALLKVLPPDVAPKVTEHIPQIIRFIEGLVANGSAYVAQDGEVFFSVRNFKGYGKLSGKNVDELMVGARVDPNEKKKDPLDFSLWKPRKREDEPAWESPWGLGRPGWHIECSVMASQYLGESFDIHGGGMDLIHPHHENEIAQSEALSKKLFAKYWMHNNMITMGKEKMSKSLGNIFLTREFINVYGAETLKFLLLSGHYRSTIDFSEKQIRDAQAGLHRLYSALAKAEACLSAPIKESRPETAEEKELSIALGDLRAKWTSFMEDDFNTARAFALLFETIRALNGYWDKKGFQVGPQTHALAQKFVDETKIFASVFNVLGETPVNFLNGLKQQVLKSHQIDESFVEEKIRLREKARATKNFAQADAIRQELLAMGIEIRDGNQGTVWDIVLS